MSTPPDRRAQADAPSLEAQRKFWDSWNASYRQHEECDPFMRRQQEEAVAVARRLGLRDARILDAGCGTGWLGSALQPWGSVTGVDLSAAAIEWGRRVHPGVRLLCGDLDGCAELGGEYDLVVSADVIGHVPVQERFVERIARLLRPGGSLLLMTQNPFVWNRSSQLAPARPGLIRNWPSRARLRELLAPSFETARLETIVPGGDRGVLWIPGNRWVRGAARRLLGERAWTGLLEAMGTGRELVVEARRRP
jgi:2-polyprenyl-3-methyl-5-hydroxy-6-metoxy-1,4-benzoquinol methylase